MFEFRWTLPSQPKPHEVVLAVHARNSWFGRKVLYVDGRPAYRRDRFSGIDHAFPAPDGSAQNIEVRLVRDERIGEWAPRLTCDGAAVPETSGTRPPKIVKAPPLIAVVVGLTCLVMFMALVTLPSIATLLDAVYGKGGWHPVAGYSPTRHLYPWITPFVVSAGCLLGFWNMRRWGVQALGIAIVLELAALLTHVAPMSGIALGVQAVLWCIGAAYYRRMF